APLSPGIHGCSSNAPQLSVAGQRKGASPGTAARASLPAALHRGCGLVDTYGLGLRRLLAEVGRDLLAGFNQALHRSDGFGEHILLGLGEFDRDNALDTLGADDHRHADIEIAHAEFAVEIGGAG